MNDDQFINGEYEDFSTHIYHRPSENDRVLLKELNKLRYKFDRGYISKESFFSQIDNSDFVGFLNEFEEEELKERHEEKKRLIKNNDDLAKSNYEHKKKHTKELKQIKFFISLIILLILIILGFIKK
jgi:hypothetical protein